LTNGERGAALTPTVQQVAHRLWARTKEHGGQTRGEFNENTRPTDVEVEEFIASSVDEVLGYCPVLPSSRWSLGREAVVIRTCMKIEMSYRPEQARDSESAYYLLRQEWLDLMGGGPSGQTGTLCGSGGSDGDAGGLTGPWRVDTVKVRGETGDPEAEVLAQVANLNEPGPE
jgi:hypothetical protein